MEKKSRILVALLLALVMVMATACSDSGSELKSPAGVNGSFGTTPGNEGMSGNEGTSGSNGDNTPQEGITIAETVLYEKNSIKVTAKSYEDGLFGPEVKLLIENDSDKNILVTADALSVNGYMMPLGTLYAEVAAGKKANENIGLMTAELDQSGIETIANIQFYLQIQDAESWDVLDTSELLTLTNTAAADYTQPVDASGDVLYDANGIKVVCKGLKQDIIWDGTVVFFIENSSGKDISVYAENVSVNGFMTEAGLWSDLRDGTRIIDGMSMIDLSELEIEKIDQIENIEFSLRIIDANTWAELVTTDAITLTFA